jgi:hypothetical protein
MDVFDKILKEHSWRFPKGYPDMDNPKDKELLFSIVEGYKYKIKEDKKSTDGVVSKEEIIKVLQDEEFSPEQLTKILYSISGVKFKKTIIDYISSKGKGPSKVAEDIYNKMVATGDVPTYAGYLDSMKSYAYLSDGGNLKEKFNFFSDDLVEFILKLEPSIGRISTGKGEILLAVMLSDVKDATSGGDIEAAGKEVEVKNKGAVPMGQKAEFGVNTMDTVYTDIEKGINSRLTNDISLRTKGKRPFNRIGIVFDQIQKEQPEVIGDFLSVIDSAFKKNYQGIDFSNINLKSYVKGSNFDWLQLEQDVSKEVVKLYIKFEGFEEIFFLNDISGNYKRVSSSNIIDQLGKEIKIAFKDGLPRWSYSF